MMRPLLPLVLLLVTPCAAQAQARISDADLRVAGITYRTDSATVRRRLGAPDSVIDGAWYYRNLTVYLEMEGNRNAGHVEQILIRTPRYATVRGLRVGDLVSKAIELYGESCISGEVMFCHPEGDEGFDERGIGIEATNGRITGIRLGAVFAI